RLEALARDIFGTAPAHPALSVPTHEIDELLLLSSWFRRFPKEMTKTKHIDDTPTVRSDAVSGIIAGPVG
ncbi:MAG TPA: hypothetical protein VM099_01415, partial [Gemmatimonadaceae bacterium]|nr:hypothetical protein [Gemmatimonadaceae bacterium]